jgi:hypothetical protein
LVDRFVLQPWVPLPETRKLKRSPALGAEQVQHDIFRCRLLRLDQRKGNGKENTEPANAHNHFLDQSAPWSQRREISGGDPGPLQPAEIGRTSAVY